MLHEEETAQRYTVVIEKSKADARRTSADFLSYFLHIKAACIDILLISGIQLLTDIEEPFIVKAEIAFHKTLVKNDAMRDYLPEYLLITAHGFGILSMEDTGLIKYLHQFHSVIEIHA